MIVLSTKLFVVLTDSEIEILLPPMSDMEIYRLLGSHAAERRKQLKLTQAEVAELIGLTRASLANLETGRQKILLHHVYKLVTALKLNSILDLLPKTFENSSEPVTFVGSEVTERQKAQLEYFVRKAGKG
jgi:transcriptional regulator with XRE-family HTH domain